MISGGSSRPMWAIEAAVCLYFRDFRASAVSVPLAVVDAMGITTVLSSKPTFGDRVTANPF
jgi:hypothetical protein